MHGEGFRGSLTRISFQEYQLLAFLAAVTRALLVIEPGNAIGGGCRRSNCGWARGLCACDVYLCINKI